jgi:hypothetical protein
MTLPCSQVTLYGAGKDAVQFHVAHDGKVEDGWWHVINVRVDAAGKVTLEDVEDAAPKAAAPAAQSE